MRTVDTTYKKMFLFVVREEQVKNPRPYLERIEEGIKTGLPMYMMIQEDLNYDIFNLSCWRKKFFFKDDKEFKERMVEIANDFRLFLEVNRL